MLQESYDNEGDIPEPYRELYSKQGDKWVFTAIPGLKGKAEVDRIKVSLEKERTAHKETKAKLEAWGNHDPEETLAVLDRIPELEAASKGALDQAQIDEIVEKRTQNALRSQIAPVERERDKLRSQVQELTDQNAELTTNVRQRIVSDAMRQELVSQKVVDTAHADALFIASQIFEVGEDGELVTREVHGTEPGLDPKTWLMQQQQSRPHWWPASEGSGAGGSRNGSGGGFGSKNPWSRENWNVTEQGRITREKGVKEAERIAGLAGTTLTGGPPAKK